jgi:S-adenosylmethionine:tRNA ribosyltransferase-isomerase
MNLRIMTGVALGKHRMMRTITPMRTDELDFDLPESLIATMPAEPRDSSRLLVVSRSDPDRLEDRVFSDLPSLLQQDDLLVFNRSSVLPARFQGSNLETGGAFEGLYLRDVPQSEGEQTHWIAYVKTKRPRIGRRVGLVDASGSKTKVIAEFVEPFPAEGPGAWVLKIDGTDGRPTDQVLAEIGGTPLPPYILSQRKARSQKIDDETDRRLYQTMYASADDPGSVAAPTAGLHFTPSVMSGLNEQGVHSSEVVLHVGAGTFKPIDADHLEDHDMHAERCSMGSAIEQFQQGKPSDKRVFAVGSTSARTLESFAAIHESGGDISEQVDTRILISPGYRWRWVDGMLTNFHLPRSTLIAMVASILDDGDQSSGIDRIQNIYAHAIHNQYRFYSYGDAMLILP